ncbi:DUF2523 domain-containing protein [Neisseria sp. N95_16]|uniref:DUF2523 domain-containing protein n=1 Tax=Neisseria brasiliensis TaxID=2666100 RepID=A0A7X2KZR7_9NEIS|nr:MULTISPECIES: DUF2523 family protein [Neisseria]MRN39304.1 DUF2523 domain-containing protein [Neisseria brasiliensis]PJO09602.1 DUF2523 domain-containing protein [Neisseria sp. N95_16]
MHIFAILGAFLRALSPLLISVVFKLFTTLGVSFVSYKALGSVLESLMSNVSAYYHMIPDAVLGLAGLAGIPEFFNILYGALNLSIGIFVAGKVFRFLDK